MLDHIDIAAEREATAALRLKRLTGAVELRTIHCLIVNATQRGRADKVTMYQVHRVHRGSFRAARRPDAVRAFDRINAQFAGGRVVVNASTTTVTTRADRERREANRKERRERANLAAALKGVKLSREAAQAILTGKAQLSRWAREIV